MGKIAVIVALEVSTTMYSIQSLGPNLRPNDDEPARSLAFCSPLAAVRTALARTFSTSTVPSRQVCRRPRVCARGTSPASAASS